MKPTSSATMRSRRESAAILQKKLLRRPAVEDLAHDNILPNKDPHKAAMAVRAKKIDRRQKQEALTTRLLQRPHRWDLHKRGVLEREGPEDVEVEVLSVRQRMKRREEQNRREGAEKPDFNLGSSKGTKSRSQLRRDEEEAARAKKRDQTIKVSW